MRFEPEVEGQVPARRKLGGGGGQRRALRLDGIAAPQLHGDGPRREHHIGRGRDASQADSLRRYAARKVN